MLITDALCYSTTDIFAAGFQDHDIGPILGVDGNTGAGGANVWTHKLLRDLYPPHADGSPYRPLPNRAGMRVSMRRTLRVGEQAGTPVEDLGVIPDLRHKMTRDDLLSGNVDLLNHAGEILSGIPVRQLQADIGDPSPGSLNLVLNTMGLSRLDVYVDGRPRGSSDITDGEMTLTIAGSEAERIDLGGFNADRLVAGRRVFL